MVVTASLAAPAALVFDLDGTLVDSRQDIASAVDALRGELGLPPLGVERVTAMVGEGARVLVDRALLDATSLSPLPDLDWAVARYLELYAARCLATTELYPGIRALLDALPGHLPLAVLTNKPTAPSVRLLEFLGLAERFQVVVAGDSLPQRKPDPAGLRLAADRLGVTPQATWLIGDSLIDVATARAAGASVVAVSWGFVARRKLLAAAPDYLVDSPPELLALVER